MRDELLLFLPVGDGSTASMGSQNPYQNCSRTQHCSADKTQRFLAEFREHQQPGEKVSNRKKPI